MHCIGYIVSDTLYPARYPVISKLGLIRPLMRCCMEAFQAIKLLRKNKYWRASPPPGQTLPLWIQFKFWVAPGPTWVTWDRAGDKKWEKGWNSEGERIYEIIGAPDRANKRLVNYFQISNEIKEKGEKILKGSSQSCFWSFKCASVNICWQSWAKDLDLKFPFSSSIFWKSSVWKLDWEFFQ